MSVTHENWTASKALGNRTLDKAFFERKSRYTMTYYLHRISHHAELSHPLLKRDILSIGWSYFATHEFVSKHRAKEWKEVPEEIAQRVDWGRTRSRFGLQRFLQMNKGDRVVVPDWGAFHVYEVDSDERMIAADLDLHDLKTWHGHVVRRENGHLYVDDEDGTPRQIDLGFFRKVKKVATGTPRSDYADNALTNRMKVRQTNVNIDDLQESVDEAIRRCQEGKPINIADSIKNKCRDEVLSRINKELGSGQLEKLIKWYFERIGALSVEIPAKNARDKEGDADIVATFEPIRTIIYVQAKHHEGTTNDWAVKQIDSYVKNKEELGEDDGYTKIPWVVSTGKNFSEVCRERAKRNNVYLIDGEELASRILDAGISDLELR